MARTRGRWLVWHGIRVFLWPKALRPCLGGAPSSADCDFWGVKGQQNGRCPGRADLCGMAGATRRALITSLIPPAWLLRSQAVSAQNDAAVLLRARHAQPMDQPCRALSLRRLQSGGQIRAGNDSTDAGGYRAHGDLYRDAALRRRLFGQPATTRDNRNRVELFLLPHASAADLH